MLLQTTNKSSDYNSSSSLDESNSEIMLQPTKSTCLRKTLNQNISSSNNTNNNIERCEFISAEPEIEENNSFSEEEDELIPNVSNISPIAPSQSPQPTTIQEKEKNLSNNSLLNSSNKRKNSHSIRMEEEGDDNEEISLPSPPSIIEENDNDNSSNNKTRNSKTRNESKRNSIKKNLTSHFESVADEDDLENISFTTTGSTTGRKRGRPSKSTTLSNKKLTTDKTPTKDSKKKKNKNKSNTSYLSYSSFTLDDDNDKTIDNDESDNDYSYRSPNITTNDEESILSLPETSINDDDDKLVNKRTPRKRFPPLQYWKGEHLFISKSKVEKVKYGVETPEKKYIIYYHIKYRKRRIEKNNKGIKKEKVKIEPCEYPSDVEEDDPYYHNFIIYDENNNESRSRTRFRSDSSNVKTINDMTISNGIKLKDSFTCGIIKLKPKSIKPKERLSHSTIVMYVVSCQENSLVLTIEKKKYLLNEEDSFYIPSNLPYSIDNRSEKQEAVIQFTLIMNKNNNS